MDLMHAGDIPRSFPSRSRANLILGMLVAAYIVSFLDRQILSLMIGPVRASLGVTDFQIGLLQGAAFAVFYAVLGLPAGYLADRITRKLLIAAAILLWTLLTIACGFADSFTTLFIARMGVGVGEAVLAPAGYSMLSDSFPPHKLMRATATFSLGGQLGAGIALIAGGLLMQVATSLHQSLEWARHYQPWQLTFVIVALPGFLIAAVMAVLPEPARTSSGTFTAAPSLAASFAALLQRWRDYAPIHLCATLLAVIVYASMAWFPTHVIRTFNWSPLHTGVTLGSIQMIGGILGTTLGIKLVGRLFKRGFQDAYLRAIMFTGIAVIPLLAATLVTNVVLALTLWGFLVLVLGFYYGSAAAAIQRLTPNRLRGLNTAVLMMCTSLGGMGVGVALVGGLSDALFSGAGAIGRAICLVGFLAACGTILIARRSLARHAVLMQKADDAEHPAH
jgi:MFS family permease